MRAADSNVVLRAILRDSPEQATAADSWIRGGAWLSHVVLSEVIWTLRSGYRLDPERLAKAVEMLLGHESFALQDPDVVTAALGAFRAQASVDFADCLILEIARKAGHGPLGTFDRALAKVDGAEGL